MKKKSGSITSPLCCFTSQVARFSLFLDSLAYILINPVPSLEVKGS